MSSNRTLSRLSRQDIALLEPHLEAVDLPVRKTLEVRRKRIDHVYFIEAGFASVVANGTSKPGIEVGIIGREGMTGLAIVLGSDRAQHATYIQAAGKGLRISAARLREADERSNTLHRAMLRYAHAFLAQTTTTALANGRSTIEERLARWLLMAADRVDGNENAPNARVSHARHPSSWGYASGRRLRHGIAEQLIELGGHFGPAGPAGARPVR